MAGWAIFMVEEVYDLPLLEEYRKAGRASIADRGGRIRVTAKSEKAVVEGAAKGLIIVEFDTYEQVRAWYESPEYQAASAIRKKACRCQVVLTEA